MEHAFWSAIFVSRLNCQGFLSTLQNKYNPYQREAKQKQKETNSLLSVAKQKRKETNSLLSVLEVFIQKKSPHLLNDPRSYRNV